MQEIRLRRGKERQISHTVGIASFSLSCLFLDQTCNVTLPSRCESARANTAALPTVPDCSPGRVTVRETAGEGGVMLQKRGKSGSGGGDSSIAAPTPEAGAGRGGEGNLGRHRLSTVRPGLSRSTWRRLPVSCAQQAAGQRDGKHLLAGRPAQSGRQAAAPSLNTAVRGERAAPTAKTPLHRSERPPPTAPSHPNSLPSARPTSPHPAGISPAAAGGGPGGAFPGDSGVPERRRSHPARLPGSGRRSRYLRPQLFPRRRSNVLP